MAAEPGGTAAGLDPARLAQYRHSWLCRRLPGYARTSRLRGGGSGLRLPLTGYPDFATWQPFLDEIITQPAPDAFRAAHNFRRTIEIPGFHVTTWFDVFQASVLAAFNALQSRIGNQKLWIGPNEHYFVYHRNFWPRDPYFAWFDYWLKGEPTGIMDGPAVFYSPQAWVEDRKAYTPTDWRYAERWPPPGARPRRLYRQVANAQPGQGGLYPVHNPRAFPTRQSRSRFGRLASSSAIVGTRAMLQWPRSPRSHPKNPRFSNSVSSRSVFARRCSRDTATLEAWIT
jgi:hypothetical protein